MNEPKIGAALLIWSASLQEPQKLATVFMAAQSYAALEVAVEMYFVGTSIELLLLNQQNTPIGYGDSTLSLHTHLSHTLDQNVQLYICSQAATALKHSKSDFIAQAAWGGLIQFAERSLHPQWVSATF